MPRDFIEDMVEERALTLDRDGFEKAMQGQRDQARAKSKFGTAAAGETAAWHVRPGVAPVPDTFRGYDATTISTHIIELLDSNRRAVDLLKAGDAGLVALADTPFYLQSGGQVSDQGRLSAAGGEAIVSDVVRGPADMPRFHAVQVTKGVLAHRDMVSADVDVVVRDATRRNHTATHLLHAALRQMLGAHVKQAGSLVAPDRLRFDFTHVGAVTREEQRDIERIVNEQVLRNVAVQTELKDTQQAIAGGAMALFGEKYGETVRVVSVPGCSTELCGGTHVRATGDIGLFTIVSEGGVAAGVRRIEAITGIGAAEWDRLHRDAFELFQAAIRAEEGPLSLMALTQAGGMVDARVTEALRAVETIRDLHATAKRLARELQQTRMKAAMGSGAARGSFDEVIEVAGVKVLTRAVSGLDKDGLRALVDEHRSRIKSGIVILASPSDGKVTVVVGVTADLTEKVPAGQVVKQIAPIVGGRGGGRPDFAEAGGKDPSKIGEMFAAARGVIETMLSAS